MYYSEIGFIAVLTLLIVNRDILFDPVDSYKNKAWNVYRRFLFAVLVYFIADILWGILESLKLAALLFADTTVYFAAMSAGILFWSEFAVAYLKEDTSFGRILVSAGRIIAGLITLLALINLFVPVLFTIDSGCVYHALPLRYVVLAVQVLLMLLISIYAFLSMNRADRASENRMRYGILASFGLIMAVFLFAQLWFPLLPLYSIAYMLGTSLLHSFVMNDEKEEYRRGQEEAERITELKETIISLLNNMPALAYTKDAKTGVYLACNQAFAKYVDKEGPEGVTGLTDEQLFDAETASHFADDDKTALSISTPYVFFEDVTDAAGNRRQLQTTKVKYRDTMGRLCILGMCQDVTDMVRIQHESAMTREAYESAVSSGIIYTHIAQALSRDYTDMFYVNCDTEEFIEYCRGDGGGALAEKRRGWHFFTDCRAELSENVFDEDRDDFLKKTKRKTLMKALDRNNSFVMNYRQKGASGPVYVRMKISRMEDDERFMIVGVTDVDSETREAMARSEALAEALSSIEEANKSRTAFLSNISHELRTPMITIIGLETLARKKDGLDAQTREYLEQIGRNAGHQLDLINGLLEMSSSEYGRIRSISALSEREAGAEDAVTAPSGSSEQKSEGRKNAADLHAPSGEDGASYPAEGAAEKNTIDLHALYVLVVDDDPIIAEYTETVLNGIGIQTDAATGGEEALRMMEEQHKRHQPYNLVLMDWSMPGMNGREASAEIRKRYENETAVVAMTAYNRDVIEEEARSVGVDSFLSKPLTAANVVELIGQLARRHETALFREKRRADLKGRRVLLAEDMEISAEIIIDILEIENISADHAENGKAAAEMFENSEPGTYCAILMDVRMPVMDGLEATARIRALGRTDAKTIPIIALTANAFDEDRQRSLQAGMNAFLSKPVDPERLYQTLGELVYEADQEEPEGRRLPDRCQAL